MVWCRQAYVICHVSENVSSVVYDFGNFTPSNCCFTACHLSWHAWLLQLWISDLMNFGGSWYWNIVLTVCFCFPIWVLWCDERLRLLEECSEMIKGRVSCVVVVCDNEVEASYHFSFLPLQPCRMPNQSCHSFFDHTTCVCFFLKPIGETNTNWFQTGHAHICKWTISPELPITMHFCFQWYIMCGLGVKWGRSLVLRVWL